MIISQLSFFATDQFYSGKGIIMIRMLVGRKDEIKTLRKLHKSTRSEFVALYGRRRVGKTYLIKELFKEQFTFQVTGLSRPDFQLQLNNFYIALGKYEPAIKNQPKPSNWLDAFQLLEAYLEKNTAPRKVVFIDELPWMETLILLELILIIMLSICHKSISKSEVGIVSWVFINIASKRAILGTLISFKAKYR